MQKIIPNIWLDNNIQEVVDYYISVFPNSQIIRTDYYTDVGKEIHGHNKGDILEVIFELEGNRFIAINGGAPFVDATAISFYYRCNVLDKIDTLWELLSDDGMVITPIGSYPFSQRYGCLKDKYGVTWQIIHSDEKVTQKIAPSLMFAGSVAGKAEEAMRFYSSVFDNSQVGLISPREIGSGDKGFSTVVYGEFTLKGQQFVAKDGLPNSNVKFSEDISLMVECETQEEIDRLWQELSSDPDAEMCGWLKDKYGVSWQIVPMILDDMLANGSPEQLHKITEAYMKMKKFDIDVLVRAYNSA